MNQCFWTNQLRKWLNKPYRKGKQLLNSWTNQCFSTNLPSKWLNKSLRKVVTCLTCEWLNVFEQISWVNDSNNGLRQPCAANYWCNNVTCSKSHKKIPTTDIQSVWNTPTQTSIVTQTVNNPSVVVRLLYQRSWNAAQPVQFEQTIV